jgi:hypothetical protein
MFYDFAAEVLSISEMTCPQQLSRLGNDPGVHSPADALPEATTNKNSPQEKMSAPEPKIVYRYCGRINRTIPNMIDF